MVAEAVQATDERNDLHVWRERADLWADKFVYIQKPSGELGPIDVYPQQAESLRMGSLRTPHPRGMGYPVHRTVVYCRPKRNHKSVDAAILAAHSVACFSRRRSFVVANSREQAQSVTFDYIRDMFRYSPGLQNMARLGAVWLNDSVTDDKLPQNATQIDIPSTGSRIRAVPQNWQTIQGLPITGVLIVEELHAAGSEDVFNMLTGQTEHKTCQVIIPSQAGSRKGALYKLYKMAGNQGGTFDQIYFDYWTENRAPWIDAEWLRMRKALLPPWEYRSLHENEWGGGTHLFMEPQYLDMLFGTEFPLAVHRYHHRGGGADGRDAHDSGLQIMERDRFVKLCEEMQWTSWAVGIGLDRAMPYAGREGTNVSAVLKALPSTEMLEAGATAGPHFWLIASVDCPSGSEGEITQAADAIEHVVGRRIYDRAYESYQAADMAAHDGAEMITPTAPRQRLLFNRMHQLTTEGRLHYSPEAVGVREELDEFTVDTEKTHPRFEHPSGGTDDRIYGGVYGLEAAEGATVMEKRWVQKPRGM